MQTRLSSGVTALLTCMLEHGANPVAIPPPPRLAAHFASTNCFAVERFRCASVWCLSGGVRRHEVRGIFVGACKTSIGASGCFLGFRNERLQFFAQPPDNIEPAVAMGKANCHSGLARVAVDFEPRPPTLHQFLFQFLLHVCSSQLARIRQVTLCYQKNPWPSGEQNGIGFRAAFAWGFVWYWRRT
jgi:hypothetical protein